MHFLKFNKNIKRNTFDGGSKVAQRQLIIKKKNKLENKPHRLSQRNVKAVQYINERDICYK